MPSRWADHRQRLTSRGRQRGHRGEPARFTVGASEEIYYPVPGLVGGSSDAAAGANTTAINAALQAQASVGLPAGNFRINNQIIAPSGRTLAGPVSGECWLEAINDFGNKAMVVNQTLNPASLAARDAGIVFRRIRLDGRKATNSTATEHAHGFAMRAVNGLLFDDVHVKAPKGDAIYLAGGNGNWHIPCGNVRGVLSTVDADRMGLATICVNGLWMTVNSYRTRYLAFDSEPNRSDELVENFHVIVNSTEDGYNTTNTLVSGCAGISNRDPGALTRNGRITINGVSPNGQVFLFRNCTGIVVDGEAADPLLNGVLVTSGGDIPAEVTLDLTVRRPGDAGMRVILNSGGTVNGFLRVEDPGTVLVNAEGTYSGNVVVSAI